MANEEKKDENLDIEDKENQDEDCIEAEIVEDDEKEATKKPSDEVNEYQERYQRLLADFDNYKKREEANKADFKKFASSSLVEKLLPVIDNLDRALAKADENDAFVEGVVMTRKELLKVLANEGLEEIPSDGCEFDHNIHQAVLAEDSDEVESNHIIETFQKGYKLNGRLLRPAMVKVAN
ncbi:nucleotide exchange factor GrpE [Anaerococcus tetradius]|uniref:Protein GrpE n=1 Tax=Anaerococcus tetradius ATCC 35098 TaxID=525255 RepID=C2CGD2_9FIRM|nr:nucleotide exchange factor GrpE [Anaerococcus tetradius]EEI83384.1 co-chaperone GrpE [Anaerococcus tetradius ATCC 35098]